MFYSEVYSSYWFMREKLMLLRFYPYIFDLLVDIEFYQIVIYLF